AAAKWIRLALPRRISALSREQASARLATAVSNEMSPAPRKGLSPLPGSTRAPWSVGATRSGMPSPLKSPMKTKGPGPGLGAAARGVAAGRGRPPHGGGPGRSPGLRPGEDDADRGPVEQGTPLPPHGQGGQGFPLRGGLKIAAPAPHVHRGGGPDGPPGGGGL